MNLSLSDVTNHCDVSSSCNMNTPFIKDVIRGVDPGVLLIGMKGGGGGKCKLEFRKHIIFLFTFCLK